MTGERVGGMRCIDEEWVSCSPRTNLRVAEPAKNTSDNQQLRNACHSDGRAAGSLEGIATMRDDYLQAALKVIDDPNILVNVISRRVKQLKRGNRALVESLEKLSPEDTALREVMEGKISYELATSETLVHGGR